MSQSPIASEVAQSPENAPTQRTIIETEAKVQEVLDALGDEDSRLILDETGSESLSAREISETCDLPISTTYRKLDALVDAGLLYERTRISRSGKHASEYSRLVSDVVFTVDSSGEMVLEVMLNERSGRSPSPGPGAGR